MTPPKNTPPASAAAGDAASLLPPGAGSPSAAKPSNSIDSVMPPGAGVAAPQSSSPSVDELLPPGAAPSSVSADSKQQTRKPKATLKIPTTDGGYVTLAEPVKKVGQGSRQRELKSLPDEEKKKRRFWKNIITVSLCALILTVSLLILVFLNMNT